MSEEEEITGFECPSCHTEVPFFIASNKRSPVAKCPNCGTIVKKTEIKGAEIKVVPRNIYDKAGKIPLEDLLREIEEREVLPSKEDEASTPEVRQEERPRNIREELFERPKDPCQVLAEILEAYGLNKTFSDWMLRRCERVGYLHPMELYHFMRTMRSGVKTEQEAAFIAEEYAQALAAEMQKAQRLNMNYPIPNLTIPMNKLNVEPNVASRLMQLIPPQQSQPSQAPACNQPYGYQPYRGGSQGSQTIVYQQPTVTPKDVIEMFKIAQDSATKQAETMINTLDAKMSAYFNTLSQTLSQALNNLASAIEKIGSNKSLDPEIIKALAEAKAQAARAEAEAKYRDEIIKIISKQYEEDRKTLIEALKERDKEIENLRNVINDLVAKMSKPVGEYKTDEAKLLAEALNNVASVGNRLVDALVSRKPLETFIQALPTLMGASQKVKTTGKTEESIVKELEEAGLVEE